MAKRVTSHSGRTRRNGGAYTVKHNDRNYDFENAPNINEDLTNGNTYWNWNDGLYKHADKEGKQGFEFAEELYYHKVFRKQYDLQQARHEASRHKDRCKSWDEWCKQKCNLPEELILQVGNTEDKATKSEFIQASNLYLKKLREWNSQHGCPFMILDWSAHFDEANPHIHLRRVWQYKENGVWCIGQEKALEQAGVPLPNPNAKPSRYNNRKMEFDKFARQLWIDCCKQVGLEIETEPVKGAKHNRTKEEVLLDKLKAEKEAFQQDFQQDLEQARQTPALYLNEFWEAFPTAKGCYDRFVNEKLLDKADPYANLSPLARKQLKKAEIQLDESLLPKENTVSKGFGPDF